MSSDSTATVTFVVTRLERVRGAGRLLALATVEIDLEGVGLVVQGMQVIRRRGRISIEAPRFRDPGTGVWMPAVILPEELGAAIAEELRRTLLRRRGGMALLDFATPLEQRIQDSLAAD